jgi:hypothetical protein
MVLAQITLVSKLVLVQQTPIQISLVIKLVEVLVILVMQLKLWSECWYNATGASNSNFFG